MRLAVILCLFLALPAQARMVTDMAGRTVEIPDRAERVACLEVLCYPRMFMLGADARIAVMHDTAAPWMTATNPRVASIPRMVGDANVEDLLARKTDLAFFRYAPEQTLARLSAAGIPALVAQPLRPPETEREFLDNSRRMVRLFGQVLGGEAEIRAEDWCAYFDERVRFVTTRVSAIPAAKRVRLYYVRGPQALSTQGRGGYTYWTGILAGADMVVRHTPLADKGLVAMEDVVRWDPDVILVGRQYPLDVVRDDPRWRTISALRNDRVHATPEGVFYWDGGPETVLLMQFIAKLLYPDLFTDFDMVAEVKAYYARFYRARLSDADVAKLLNGQAPDGSRFNPTNN
jgi:ABC-type Fe3+-hydroxamate transport system, periplasmic component